MHILVCGVTFYVITDCGTFPVLDDIPIQAPKDDAGGEGKNLMSIAEEKEEESEKTSLRTNSGSFRAKELKEKTTPKLPTFSGLTKKKEKDTKVKNGDKIKEVDKKQEKKEVEKVVAKKKEENPPTVNRNSAILNGDAGGDADSALKKKSSLLENSNGIELGSLSLNSDERISVSDSLAISERDTMDSLPDSPFTNSMDSTSNSLDEPDKLISNAVNHRNVIEIENKNPQVSSV